VGNDLITVLRHAPNPVLAHHFMNYLVDLQNALTNYSYTGYMQPLTGITPQRLVQEQLLPKTLMSTTVLPSYFRRGVMELQLPVTAQSQWSQAWLQAKSA
jgi:spermidine/putrescine-binding protein